VEEMVGPILRIVLTCRYVTLTVSAAILVANFGTSIVSPGLEDIAEVFGVGLEVGILGISMYLIGFGKGLLLSFN
jgi:hypothetical protein